MGQIHHSFGRSEQDFSVFGRYLAAPTHTKNRHWIKREIEEGGKEVYEVYTVCLVKVELTGKLSLVIWKRSFFDPIKHRLTAAIISLIEKERSGEQIDTSLVKGVIDAYGNLLRYYC